jgi:N-acetylneuraminic acid mutarotase
MYPGAPWSDYGLAVLNHNVYFIGGIIDSDPRSGVRKYDVQRDAWSVSTPLPYTVNGLGATAVGGKLFAVGGVGLDPAIGCSPRGVLEYDLVSQYWSDRAALLQERVGFALVSAAGKLYAMGGATPCYGGPVFDQSRSAEKYDPAADAWSLGAPLPAALREISAAYLGGNIYVIGGHETIEGSFVDNLAVDEFDLSLNQWIFRTAAPFAGTMAAAVDGEIYVAG